MESHNIEYLLGRLHAGQASEDEMLLIEQLLSSGVISIATIDEFAAVQDRIDRLGYPETPKSLDNRFYAMLAAEKKKRAAHSWGEFFSWPTFAPRFALASVMLIIGIVAGFLLRTDSQAPAQQIELLSQQVTDLQEMMMLSLLEKGSATERLKAVSLTQEMDEASKKVTSALIQTLNEDENINVRLAALEALKPYAGDSSVREALIRSISRQESPLVQISLAELMVALQEKAAVEEFEKLMESENTPPEIKRKIKESINVLI